MNYVYLRFKKHNFIYYMINPKKSDLLILLGKRIRYLRLKKKMSQRDLGIEALMEKSTIQRIERGLMNCTINTLLRLANALGVSISSLLDFNDPMDEIFKSN